ncbi:hypothetical protein [Natronococcus jeotgali]|uniref:Uncharacterized protein n=1 Tax=Natronococcus jeotgali DSM 18795 TaxID=1227498 RepID=L9X7P7_9EURY|nr:hypothetical protein [Natronococcus jeotgali]ELY57789.1 hypothetical protein C492_12744 [Natronococcus jeotgali DSM 18795]
MSDTDRDEPRDARDESVEAGRMLARTWTVAANFRSPCDYGIPTAPTFAAERRADGTLALFACPTATEPVLTASRTVTVRR